MFSEYTTEELQNIFMMQGFSGLSLFSVLLLMGLGLALIFGQMGVINMAHGEFMALGAYTVYFCSTLTEQYARRSVPTISSAPSASRFWSVPSSARSSSSS